MVTADLGMGERAQIVWNTNTQYRSGHIPLFSNNFINIKKCICIIVFLRKLISFPISNYCENVRRVPTFSSTQTLRFGFRFGAFLCSNFVIHVSHSIIVGDLGGVYDLPSPSLTAFLRPSVRANIYEQLEFVRCRSNHGTTRLNV